MEWFKHLTASHEDKDISNARNEFGHSAYVVFFIILEIYGREFNQIDEQGFLELTKKFLCKKLRMKWKQIELVINWFSVANRFVIKIEKKKMKIKIPKFLEIASNWTKREYKSPKEIEVVEEVEKKEEKKEKKEKKEVYTVTKVAESSKDKGKKQLRIIMVEIWEYYKILKGWGKEADVNYDRNARTLKKMVKLVELNGLEKTKEGMEAVKEWLENEELIWTLETLLRWYPEVQSGKLKEKTMEKILEEEGYLA